jgi:hypothetical protein
VEVVSEVAGFSRTVIGGSIIAGCRLWYARFLTMTSKPDPSERRQHFRLTRPFDGSWRGASGDSPCRISDISLGGCFVQSVSSPEKGEETTVTIVLNDERTIAMSGTVVYVEPHMGFAVRFRRLEPAERDELTRVIDSIKQSPQ